MAAKTIKLRMFLVCVAAVVLCEAGFAYFGPFGPGWTYYALVGGLRLVEAGLILLAAVFLGKGLELFGITCATLGRGVSRGALWCLGLGAIVGMSMAAIWIMGINPVNFFQNPHAGKGLSCLMFLLAGSIVSPVAEELFFRGVLYGFFRRWGVIFAVCASTALFVLVHASPNQIPVTQAVGGLVFAISYEKEKNLLAPLMIHMSGNCAIFALGVLAG